MFGVVCLDDSGNVIENDRDYQADKRNIDSVEQVDYNSCSVCKYYRYYFIHNFSMAWLTLCVNCFMLAG